MAGSRTLKLSILAETADLVRGLDKANQETQTFGDKVEAGFAKVGKAAALATAAIGALALKVAVDGVKAAIEDEAAQAKLAATLGTVTKATDLQIASVEKYITETSLAVGVTDDELRPSLDRLLRSVKNIDEAIRLQTLALDISAGTGKSLAQVSEALAKAYDGNFGALKRLGGGIDEGIIKSKDFDAAVNALTDTFGGRADVAANTYQGKMARLNIAINEAKESIGAALLPTLTRLTDSFINNGIPALNAFIAGLTGKEGLKTRAEETSPKVAELASKTRSVEEGANAAGLAIQIMGKRVGELFAIIDIALGGEGSGFGGLLKILKAIQVVLSAITEAMKGLINFVKSFGNIAANSFQKLLEILTLIRKGFVGDFTAPNVPKQFNQSAFSVPSTSNLGMATGSANYITVNGAIDPEGTARTIVGVLNNSSYRGTLGGGGIIA